MKKKFNNREGMTLVEIIVSIALLGIIAALVLMVFSSSMLMIVNSGDNTKAAEGANIETVGYITSNVTGSQISTVNFDGHVTSQNTITVSGIIEESNVTYNSNNTIMKVFKTNPWFYVGN